MGKLKLKGLKRISAFFSFNNGWRVCLLCLIDCFLSFFIVFVALVDLNPVLFKARKMENSGVVTFESMQNGYDSLKNLPQV
ncbi:UNVERIFIED_ORG: hypothetical protein J2806_001795 [Kosakonia oryzae]|uniref:hypothetical protein n=1 Tax=Kosakonia radicincitans TaxID=283686 RepID=UPI00141DE60B|nr:hypothetical protein [Kosakonia radicincitans]MDP9566143.1 hypothetical protein [Kosakonia oryzae]